MPNIVHPVANVSLGCDALLAAAQRQHRIPRRPAGAVSPRQLPRRRQAPSRQHVERLASLVMAQAARGGLLLYWQRLGDCTRQLRATDGKDRRRVINGRHTHELLGMDRDDLMRCSSSGSSSPAPTPIRRRCTSSMRRSMRRGDRMEADLTPGPAYHVPSSLIRSSRPRRLPRPLRRPGSARASRPAAASVADGLRAPAPDRASRWRSADPAR